MLIPRRVKHRKQHHPSRTGAAKGGTQIAFGDFGIQAIEPRLRHEPADRVGPYRDDPAHQAWRQGVDQHLPRPPADQEAGRDPDGFRQGLAGVVDRQRQAGPGHVRAVRRARSPIAREAMRRAMHKLPMKCRFVRREEV